VGRERKSNGVDQRASEMSLRAGLALSGLTYEQLWAGYIGLGGTLERDQLRASLEGKSPLGSYEHDMVAQALNDHFTERGLNHPVAYAHELRPPPDEAR
jgi:hypothetical protein